MNAPLFGWSYSRSIYDMIEWWTSIEALALPGSAPVIVERSLRLRGWTIKRGGSVLGRLPSDYSPDAARDRAIRMVRLNDSNWR